MWVLPTGIPIPHSAVRITTCSINPTRAKRLLTTTTKIYSSAILKIVVLSLTHHDMNFLITRSCTTLCWWNGWLTPLVKTPLLGLSIRWIRFCFSWWSWFHARLLQICYLKLLLSQVKWNLKYIFIYKRYAIGKKYLNMYRNIWLNVKSIQMKLYNTGFAKVYVQESFITESATCHCQNKIDIISIKPNGERRH